ncbi:YggS family pyridoxal phosphate-dependent enzyme [Marinifilum caeruleilacunae]|uniref:Pyridoxal phosphate homeostasis protein n=1 Tax=Marinifilum caeruleilacunae TaxID=2499076 RepID=A0ABX1WXK6_9BACT|nr:YggS family pyridoxal phosphate-dependent enzyme [Marinifilum caeruleilacunae]NOU60619.1 YggS family pyridoxal phosphate-dependent enzyme [Marinifilum caeruleilacunae]
MSIPQRIQEILDTIPENVTLVAVSKTKPNEDILEAYNSGYRIFGENKPQELTRKYNELPKDIKWHMIGHLQSNKVKYIAPFVSLIHAVDSFKLLKEINKQAAKNERVIDCLMQFHIADEETKFGLDINEAREIFNSDDYKNLQNIRIVGVMGMATYTDDETQIRSEFKNLKSIYSTLKEEYYADEDGFAEISMGMSGDYNLAIEEGSSMIRVGSTIFGARNYANK